MKPPLILVVDDEPVSLQVLEKYLTFEGFTVETAMTGAAGVEKALQLKPNLILLDVMMPDCDGLEICKQLQAHEETATTPIIFITAKQSKEHKLEGLSVGAVDYITKPIEFQEALARIKTQLKLQKVYKENINLQKELGEARRNVAIGSITEGIAHNINNLLGGIKGHLDLLRILNTQEEKSIYHMEKMDESIHRMVEIVNKLRTISITQNYMTSDILLAKLVKMGVQYFMEEHSNATEIPINSKGTAGVMINSCPELVQNAISNLLINAWESYGDEVADEARRVEIDLEQEDGFAQIKINDWGKGISTELLDTLYEPFSTRHAGVGRGLGLTLAKHFIKNVGGTLELHPREEGGTCATIKLPLNKEAL